MGGTVLKNEQARARDHLVSLDVLVVNLLLTGWGLRLSAWSHLRCFLLVNGRTGLTLDFPGRIIPACSILTSGKKSPLSYFLAPEVTDWPNLGSPEIFMAPNYKGDTDTCFYLFFLGRGAAMVE